MLNREFFEYLTSGDPLQGSIGHREFYILRRHGHDLLAIPRTLRFSADALGLYLPQTAKARAAKGVFTTLLHTPLASILPTRDVAMAHQPLTDFLCSLAGGELPEFAVLLGNPAEPGRRFVVGVFDKDGKCHKVVKCAIDPTGRELLSGERKVLERLQGNFPDIPKVLAAADEQDFGAIAMDFFSKPETPPTRSERVALVERWIRPEPALPLESLPAWPTLAPLRTDFAGVLVRPVVFHGDFTPWNIRRYHDDWMVIDWEKSSTHGPPLWDLLHYEIHEEILVHRSAVQSVRERIQRLLDSPETSDYLAHCGAKEHAQLLLRGYLAHLNRIYPPIRGRETVDALIESFA